MLENKYEKELEQFIAIEMQNLKQNIENISSYEFTQRKLRMNERIANKRKQIAKRIRANERKRTAN